MRKIINAVRQLFSGKSRTTHHAAALLVDVEQVQVEPEIVIPEPEDTTQPQVIYELPMVDVIKRKSKIRATSKHTRKTRKKMTKRGK